MNIPSFPFSEGTKSKPNNPFPQHIADDPNVLYHGTSSTNELSIENSGLKINTTVFSKKEIEDVLELFDSVKWPHKKFWSESNLQNYSLNHDFKNEDLKPIYLGECAERVSLFASKEFAGGEIARSVRNAFIELEKLFTDPKELEKELARIETESSFTGRTAQDYDLDLSELKKMLDAKRDYYNIASQLKDDYQYGIIYAIKIEAEDEPHLEYSIRSQMGVKCYTSLPASRIIAKTTVSPEYINDFNKFINYRDLPCSKPGGIFYRIKNDTGESLASHDKKVEEIMARVKNQNL